MITSILRLMTPNRPQLRILVGLMGSALLLASFLAFQVYQAGRGHMKAAETELEDRAMSTADEWNRVVDEMLGRTVTSALDSAIHGWDERGGLTLVEVEELVDFDTFDMIAGAVRRSVLGYFVLDLQDGTLKTTEGGVADRDAGELARRFRLLARPAIEPWQVQVEPFPMTDGETRVYVGAIRLVRGTATVAFGWYSDEAFVRTTSDIMRGLLKPLAAHFQDLDSVFAVKMAAASGAALYESIMTESRYSAEANRPPLLMPTVVTTVKVLPEAEERLLSGRWPPTRLPQTLALLGLTACVIAVTMMLIRREAELVRLRADFVAGVSHELRTPLAQIRMFTETLLLGRVRSEAERHRSLEIIDQEAQRLAHLVQNVLMFARSERGHARLTIEPRDVAADVRDALHGFAILTRTKAVDIRPELQEGITLAVDRSALRQVLLNLLDNAVKYGPLSQRITVGLGLFGGNARCWVDDEGPGIPPAERTRVFESFYRIERDALSAIAGSGIGLAIVSELVTLHGGSVWIDEAPGGGARVVVEFPGGYLRPEAAKEGWAVA